MNFSCQSHTSFLKIRLSVRSFWRPLEWSLVLPCTVAHASFCILQYDSPTSVQSEIFETTRQQVYNRRFLRTSRLPFCSRESKSGHEEDKLASLCCSHSTTRKSFWLDHHRPATSVRGPREPLPRNVRWVAFFAAALFRFQVAFSHELFLSVAHIFLKDPFVCTEFLETP